MQLTERIRIIKRTIAINASVNVMLALLKIIIGFLGHSQALIADGVHSFTDLVTDGLVFFAAKAGAQKPDKAHPYGHRRIETLATVIIAIVLASVAIGIARETITRIIMSTPFEKPDYIVLIIAISAIIANEFLFYYNMNRGNKIDSGVLRSNAWHNRSDTLVSVIVLISVIGSLLGAHYLDAIGALFIAALILKMAIKMIWTSVKELIDTGVDAALIEKISQHILAIDGITAIHQLRTRCHGGNIFLDTHVEVTPNISVSEGHYISEQVGIQLGKRFPQIIDATIHIDPENDEIPTTHHLPSRPEIEALLKKQWQNLASANEISRIVLHYISNKVSIEIYLPLATLDNQDKKALTDEYNHSIEKIAFINNIKVYFH